MTFVEFAAKYKWVFSIYNFLVYPLLLSQASTKTQFVLVIGVSGFWNWICFDKVIASLPGDHPQILSIQNGIGQIFFGLLVWYVGVAAAIAAF